MKNNNLGVSCSTYLAALGILALMLIFGSCGEVPDYYYARGMNVYLPDSARVEYIMPVVDQNKDAARLGIYISKKWPREKRVYDIFFTDGDDDIIAKTMGDWNKAITTKTGIQFVRTYNRTIANMAVSFTANNQAWSYVGTDCDYLAKTRVTMNLGWHIRYRENQGGERYGTGVHEMMHGLGYVHTLQDPACANTLVWDKECEYAKLKREQGWDRAMVDAQVFTTYPASEISHNGCDFKSIMCYPVNGCANVVVGRNNEMSPTDDAKLIADYKEVIVPPVVTGGTGLISVGMPSAMSSSYRTGEYPAKNGNDNNLGTFMHTAGGERYPWYEINLQASKNISYVVVYNRKDCCQGRLYTWDLMIDNVSVYRNTHMSQSWDSVKIAVNKPGTRVKVLADNPQGYELHLREVKVYSGKGTVIEPPKPVCKDTVYKIPVWTQTMRDSVGRVCR